MKVSVIIPSYGQAQYLGTAITSAITQNHPISDLEIIVVDDGSTDGSLDVAKKYLDTEANYKIIQQVNKGLASARNAGIMNATGEYILPLDADDWLKQGCIETIVDVAKETKADVIAPSITCFNDKDEAQTTILMEDPTFDDFKDGNRLAYCSAIKRSVLLEVGGYSSRYDALGGWEDLALWYDLMRRGKKFVTIQDPLVMYRVKEESMWKTAEKNKKALWAQLVKDFPETKDHAKA